MFLSRKKTLLTRQLCKWYNVYGYCCDYWVAAQSDSWHFSAMEDGNHIEYIK